MNTGQATNIAMHTALDKAGVQDDITVLVVDLLPNAHDRCAAAMALCVRVHVLVCACVCARVCVCACACLCWWPWSLCG